jgi:hypothetical protein
VTARGPPLICAQWQLVKAGTCWALQARGGAFLGVEGPAARGRALCALCEPYGWDVRPYNHTPAAVRCVWYLPAHARAAHLAPAAPVRSLYVPGTPFCVDLAHDGASAGVPLTLQEAVDARNQSWRLDNAWA